MNKTFVRAGALIGYRLRTTDGAAAAVRDLIVNLADWSVAYLAVQAEAWPAGREVLVAPRSLTAIDDPGREIGAALTFEQVQNSPSLARGTPVTRDFQENLYRYYGWQGRVSAEFNAEPVAEPGQEPPIPAAPPAEEPRPGEVNADLPGLARFESIRDWRVRTDDGRDARLRELLLDDSDWTIAYLEILIGKPPKRERCLLRSNLVAWSDPAAECIYLTADAADIRHADPGPYPALGEDPGPVRILNGSAAPSR